MEQVSGTKPAVTWQLAEDHLLAAIEYLGALPDRDASALRAGSRSAWPAIVRSVRDGDYGDGQGYGAAIEPSARLTRRRLALVEAMLLNPGCAADAIPEAHRALVGRVLVMKLRESSTEPFGWDRVWRAERERWRRDGSKPVTSDALRVRYSRAIERVAGRMERLGLGQRSLDD